MLIHEDAVGERCADAREHVNYMRQLVSQQNVVLKRGLLQENKENPLLRFWSVMECVSKDCAISGR